MNVRLGHIYRNVVVLSQVIAVRALPRGDILRAFPQASDSREPIIRRKEGQV